MLKHFIHKTLPFAALLLYLCSVCLSHYGFVLCCQQDGQMAVEQSAASGECQNAAAASVVCPNLPPEVLPASPCGAAHCLHCIDLPLTSQSLQSARHAERLRLDRVACPPLSVTEFEPFSSLSLRPEILRPPTAADFTPDHGAACRRTVVLLI